MVVEGKWWHHEGICSRFSSMAWDEEEDKRRKEGKKV
jgi:hypothetical protein